MNVLTKLWWGRCIGFLVVMLLVATQQLALAAAGDPSGSGIQPTEHAGNPTCSVLMDEGAFAFEIKIDDPQTGDSLTVDGVTVTITDVRNTSAGQVFDWSSEGGVVNGVFVKGGPGGNLYLYDPAATSDTGLHAPINPNNGRYYGLSHVSFCVTPGVASIDVTKACDEQSVNVDVVSTRNTVTLLNDGDFELTGIQIREETAGLTCSLTKVDGVAVDVALPLNTDVLVPNGGSFDGNLAVGESVALEVTCADGALNLANTITGTASSAIGPVDDTSTNDPAVQCPFSPNPQVSIDKDCVDESDVRLMATPDGAGGTQLSVQVCPTVIVSNESGTEPLSSVIVVDSQIPALAGGVDALAAAGLTQLNPGESINLGDFVDLCYMPSAPEVAEFEDGKYLPSQSGFLNIASVDADGKFGGNAQDSDDTALRDAEGNILYLLDEEGAQVLDTAGNPIPLSECPLCAPCPDCPAPL